MEVNLKDRVRSVRKENGLSQVQYAEKLNITQSVVSLIESGKAAVSVEVLKNISSTFDVSCDWLVYGKKKYTSLSFDNDFIPLIDVEARAGYISQYGDMDFLESLGLYKIPGFENGNFRIYEVDGDSMMPTIIPRDKVICVHTSLKDIIDGSLCVLVTSNDVILKRVYSTEDDNTFILKSDNPNFKKLEISDSEISEVWIVQAKLTTSFSANGIEQNKRLDDLESELKEIKNGINSLLVQMEGEKNSSQKSPMKGLWPKDKEIAK